MLYTKRHLAAIYRLQNACVRYTTHTCQLCFGLCDKVKMLLAANSNSHSQHCERCSVHACKATKQWQYIESKTTMRLSPCDWWRCALSQAARLTNAQQMQDYEQRIDVHTRSKQIACNQACRPHCMPSLSPSLSFWLQRIELNVFRIWHCELYILVGHPENLQIQFEVPVFAEQMSNFL